MGPTDPTPSRDDDGLFAEGGTRASPAEAPRGQELASLFRSLLRAELSGARPGAVLQVIEEATGSARERLAHALNDALRDDEELTQWIDADEDRRKRAGEIALRIAGEDISIRHNVTAVAALKGFRGFGDHAFHVIVVPGFTPLDAKVAAPGVHPLARRRLEGAAEGFRAGKAPFVLVTGGNIHPRGTPYYEGIEMKKELLAMGVPEDRIVVDARARQSTTNLRNAGRYMLEHGMRVGVIATAGGGDPFEDDFNPTISTFHARCERELGYRVGELRGAGAAQTEFMPSEEVRRIGYRDVLDP